MLQVPSRQELAAILVLCTGVGLATVSGGQIDTTLAGATVAAAAVAVTALYQVGCWRSCHNVSLVA